MPDLQLSKHSIEVSLIGLEFVWTNWLDFYFVLGLLLHQQVSEEEMLIQVLYPINLNSMKLQENLRQQIESEK